MALSRRWLILAALSAALAGCVGGGSATLSSPATSPLPVVSGSSSSPFTAPPTTVRTIGSVDECSPVPPSVGVPDPGPVEHVGAVTIFFEESVSPINRERVRSGLAAAQEYITGTLGGFRFREPICIDARGGGGGSTVVGVVYGANHIVVYTGARALVAAPSWLLPHVTAHELMHFWQKDVGSPREAAGPVWLLEGAAELLGYRALVAAGVASEGETRNYSLRRVEPDTPSLSSLERRGDPDQFSYPLSYLATELLTAERGPTACREYWRALSRGKPWEAAFTDAFGIGPEAFYARFEEYRSRGFQ